MWHLPGAERLLALLQEADDDPWRYRFREAIRRADGQAQRDLANDPNVLDQPTGSVLMAARTLRTVAPKSAIDLLRRAQVRHPADFWINEDLGLYLKEAKPSAPAEAVGYYRAALALRPESPGAHLNLANALSALGQEFAAITEYQEAIRLKPDYLGARFTLACLLISRGKRQEAEAECRECLRLDPTYARAHFGLGEIFLKDRRLKEAEAEFREALRLEPNLIKARVGLVHFFFQERKYAEAEAEARETVRLAPDFADAHAGLADAFRHQGKYPEAETEYRKAIDLDPGYIDPYIYLGHLLFGQKRLTEATALQREAVRRFPESAKSHAGLADAFRYQERFAEAETEYREAVRLDPTYPGARFTLASVLERLQKMPEAIAEYQGVLRGHPENAKAHAGLGRVFRVQRKLPEAEIATREAIRLLPAPTADVQTMAGYQRQLGEILMEQRKCAQAIPCFTQLGSLQPNEPWWWYFRALAHLGAGDGDGYRDVCRSMLARWGKARDYPTAERVLYTCVTVPAAVADPEQLVALARADGEAPQVRRFRILGAALYRNGKFEEAVRQFREAKTESRKDPWESCFLAMALQRLGRRDEARRSLDAVFTWGEQMREQSAVPWWTAIEMQALIDEAERLLEIPRLPHSKP
jgi:tetratricopeptide (TPR) repeat protein